MRYSSFLLRAIGISGIAIGLVISIGSLALFGLLFFSGMLPIVAVKGIIYYLILIIFGVGLLVASYKFLKREIWAYKTIRVLLMIFIVGSGLLFLYQLVNLFQSGFEETETIKAIFLTGLFIISGVISIQLQTPALKAFFSIVLESVESTHFRKFKRILLYGGVSILILLIIPLGLPFVSKERWPFVRAKIAEKTGGTEYALGLYAKTMVEANSQTIKDNARDAISKLQFTMAIKHYQKGELNQAVEILSLLAQTPLDLDKQTKEQLPEILYSYGMKLKDKKEWDMSRSLFVALVRNYPTHKLAEKVGELQKWYFSRVLTVTSKEELSIPIFQRTKTGISKIDERKITTVDGASFLLIDVEIVHLGRRTKELQAASFTLRDENGHSFKCLGFNTVIRINDNSESVINQIWNDGKISIGPDPIQLTLIFTVPKGRNQLKLDMLGNEAVKIDLNL